LFDSVDDLNWTGPTPAFAALGAQLDAAVTDKTRAARDLIDRSAPHEPRPRTLANVSPPV
jgi:hypothetical protein